MKPIYGVIFLCLTGLLLLAACEDKTDSGWIDGDSEASESADTAGGDSDAQAEAELEAEVEQETELSETLEQTETTTEAEIETEAETDAPGPFVKKVVHSGCQGSVKSGSEEEIEAEDPSITAHYDTDTGLLIVAHKAAQFNCCIERLESTVKVEGALIKIFEIDIKPNPCKCYCPYDMFTSVKGLEPGTYTVEVYANGALAGTVETVNVPGER